MADPLEAYNKEIQRRSGPFGLDPAQTKGGAALQFPLEVVEGLGQVLPFIQDTMQDAGAGIINYFKSPSSFVEDVRSGKIPESEISGTDLVDIFGDIDPTLGAPDFVTDDYNVGEIFKFDPTGEGKTKGMPETKAEREGREAKAGLDAEIQAALDGQFDQVAAQKKKDAQRAEDFRKKEAQIADMAGQGSYNQSIDTITNSEQMFASAMQDYIEGVRGTGPDIKDPKSIEKYKEEFAKATGISIDGKPDKSQALMAFGLELMRNKAGGKGITGMLDAIGVAGQAAMPALEKARERSRQDGIAAGKFALEMRSADQAKSQAAKEKAMERSDYFIVPKSDNYKGLLANLAEGRGKRQSLSKYELDKLMKNPDFSDQFEALPGSVWSSVISEAMKTPEAKEYFDTTPRPMSLITGDDDPMYTIDVFYGLPNKAKRGQVVGASDPQIDSAYRALQKRFKSNQTNKEKFVDLQTMTDEGAVNVFSTLVDVVDSAASSFGINVAEGANANAKMKAVFEELQAKQASNILGEGGKNTSDFERQLVKSIVGTKDLFSEPDLIEFKLAKLYNDVVIGEENKILEGLTNLDQVSGKQISSYFGDGELTEAERKSMNADLKTLGVVK